MAAALLVMAAGGWALGLVLNGQPAAGADAQDLTPQGDQAGSGRAMQPLDIYITDLPANLTALDVSMASVAVGPDGILLPLVNPSFDLASLQGPQDALLVASGDVPVGVSVPIVMTFGQVIATIGGQAFDVTPKEPLVVLQDPSLGNGTSALLTDVDLAASLLLNATTWVFEPRGQTYAAPVSVEVGTPHQWVEWVTQSPAVVATAGLVSALADAAGLGPVNPDLDAGLEAVGAAGGPDPGAASPSLGTADQTGWLVRFVDGTGKEDMERAADTAGATWGHALTALPIAYVQATDRQVALLAADARVAHIEAEQPIRFDDAQSRLALRMPQLLDPVSGLKDAAGNTVDGRGIGVAVVDTGIDATHPDLPYAQLVPGAVVAVNLKIESIAAVPLPDTDTTSGHGTHVAAIVAGQGVLDPQQRGVAPGARLYGLGIGEASTTVWAAQAFDWVLANHDAVSPRIRVVTNSWSTGTTYDPNAALTLLVNQMVQRGMVVVFSAGNNGGNGSSVQTSAQCQIPTPGVLCVAAFDDLGVGTRDGKVAAYSSRGHSAQPGTWPDVSAPGTSLRSARPPAGTVTGVGTSQYVELSGTSQAAPHVAGVAALMLQANPGLTPATLDARLVASAYPFADGGAYNAYGTHVAKGHGLVDAYAAVAAAKAP